MGYFSRPDEPCLIDPRRARDDPAVGPLVLLILTAADLARWQDLTGGQKHHDFGHYGLYRRPAEPGTVSAAGPALGAPQAALILEKLIALGGRGFLVLGWCGSLREDLGVGGMVLVKRAVSQEGISRHYPLGRRRPAADPALTAGLRKTLEEAGADYAEGTVWTTDAPYRETVAAVRQFQARGVLGVDMEASALLSVAAFRRVELALLLVVSDELHSLKWKHGFRTARLARARDQALEIMTRTADRLGRDR